MSKRMKIALSGIAGSGKDYLGNHLVKELNFKRFAFADELKKIAKTIYPYLKEDYEAFEKETPLNIDTGFEKITKTPREIWLVVNKIREVEDSIFIRRTHETIQASNHSNTLITDVRTLEEFEYCKKHGYTIIHITPSELIYEPNEYDKQILEFKDECVDFYNDFDNPNTLKEFEELVRMLSTK
jgi:tRNA uridine 5-carbamoylmethylation protein Kti12